MMQKHSADYIFSISTAPIKNGVVVIDDNGIIMDVLSSDEGLEDVQYHSGIICPGFINAHCHLELSHLKGMIPSQKGIVEFIKAVVRTREINPDVITDAMMEAEKEMRCNGIVAVGDISNSKISFPIKVDSPLNYHTFIEVIGFHPKQAEVAIRKGLDMMLEYPNKSSITPHAPYSVSKELFQAIDAYCQIHENNLISIHNQESQEENKFFKFGKGELLDMIKEMGIETGFCQPTNTNPLRVILNNLSPCKKLLLVHNTFTKKEDIEFANSNMDIYWCFCPNSNLYIENSLPNFNLFNLTEENILLGTDSLASNKSLSILEEIKTISKHAPDISLEQMLQWATMNGAKFFGWENALGSLEKGKQPGLNCIKEINSQNISLTNNSYIETLF